MKTDLLRFSDNGGCSAKLSPSLLEEVLRNLPVVSDPNVLVDISTHDDAGVYKINDDLALIFTTDFFPPVCSDPYEYGQIAAANSISDVYAMGGRPVIALNIMMFPSAGLPVDAYAEILRGGSDKAAEAGVSIIGGHTIDDAVPKYGLAVTGFVHPDAVITNSALQPGDILILTKPVGTGTVLAASRLGMASDDDLNAALRQMKMLNRDGAAVMTACRVKSATDITGFGLGGHALKMARASKVSVHISMPAVPVIGNTLSYLDEGCIPGAAFRNLAYAETDTSFETLSDYNLKMLAFDAQTSGGLLMAVREEMAREAISMLHNTGHPLAAVVGNVTNFTGKYLYLKGV